MMSNSVTRITKLENGTLVIQGVYDTINQDLVLIDPTDTSNGVNYNQLKILGYNYSGNTGTGVVALKGLSNEILHQVSINQNDTPVILPVENYALSVSNRTALPTQTLKITASVVLGTFSVYIRGVFF